VNVPCISCFGYPSIFGSLKYDIMFFIFIKEHLFIPLLPLGLLSLLEVDGISSEENDFYITIKKIKTIKCNSSLQ